MRTLTLTALCTFGLMSLSPNTRAQETLRYEALGVVNGSMTARQAGVEITVFLSGQPLFTAANTAESEPLSSVLIEQAQLVSRENSTVRLGQSFSLPQGQRGQWQLPVQVQVNGKAVTVSAQETALGVLLTLPAAAASVTVVPVGAATLFVPATYRGDLSMDLRITGAAAE